MKSRLEPANQAREVGALSAVERVQLVDDKEPHGASRAAAPQVAVAWPHHQVVEHLVVRQEDVRRQASP